LFLCGLTQLLIAVVYHVNPHGAGTGQAVVALSVLYILFYNVSVP